MKNKCSIQDCEYLQYGRNVLCYKHYMKEYNKKNYEKNYEKIKLDRKNYHHKNIIEIKARRKKAYQENPEKYREEKKLDHIKHKDIRIKKMNEKYKLNAKEICKKQYQYKKKKYHSNNLYRLKEQLSARIRGALKHNYKSDSTLKLLGVPSIEFLKDHLNKTAPEGITINDIGINTYHIDHYIPCDAFNLEDEYEQKLCFNYKNLRIEKYDANIKKATDLPYDWEEHLLKIAETINI